MQKKEKRVKASRWTRDVIEEIYKDEQKNRKWKLEIASQIAEIKGKKGNRCYIKKIARKHTYRQLNEIIRKLQYPSLIYKGICNSHGKKYDILKDEVRQVWDENKQRFIR